MSDCSLLLGCLLQFASGCSSSPSLNLQGNLTSATSAAHLEPTKLAIAWYPVLDASVPGDQLGAIVSQPNVSFSGDFPVQFTFTLEGAPPAAALFDLSRIQNGSTGHYAYGVLLAYRDGNGNGVFDPISDGHTLIDTVVGASFGDPSRPPPEPRYYVIYLDGQLAPRQTFAAFHLPQGYSLLENRYRVGSNPVPLDTPIEIPITQTQAVNIYACPDAFAPGRWPGIGCGIDPFGGRYRAEGQVFIEGSGTRIADVEIYDASGPIGDATVAIDGTPIPYCCGGGVYTRGSLALLPGTHTVTIDVPGFETETIHFMFPEQVQLVTPSDGQTLMSGRPLTVSWTAAAGTAHYRPYLFVDEDGSTLGLTTTAETSFTLTPPPYVGNVEVSVRALGNQGNGLGNAFITPYSMTRMHVTFVQ